jgi:hypothetical protein
MDLVEHSRINDEHHSLELTMFRPPPFGSNCQQQGLGVEMKDVRIRGFAFGYRMTKHKRCDQQTNAICR